MAYLSAPFIGAGCDPMFSYITGDEEEPDHFNNDSSNIMHDAAFEWLGIMRHLQTNTLAYRTNELKKFKEKYARILNQGGVVIDPKIWNKKLSLEKDVFYANITLSTSKERIEKIEKKFGKDFIQKELAQYYCRVIKKELLAITLHPDNKNRLLSSVN